MTTTPVQPPVDELTPAVASELDKAIDELQAGAAAWARLSVGERADLVEATHAAIGRQAQRWVQAAVKAKNVPAGPWVGEEWLSGPYATLAGLATLAKTLRMLAQGRSPLDGVKARVAPGGRVALKMLPEDAKQGILLHGFSGEVWLRPGVTLDQARAAAGLGAKQSSGTGVGLVLGAGNISSIAPLDVIYELVAHNRASIVKLNPTFATLEPVLRDALAPLVEFGVVRVVNGAAAVGGYLADHPKISHVHITGSGATHDAIVWGTGEEGARRRAQNDPKLRKPITSELGGVSPIIVVPGRWSKADIRFQAEQVATQRLHNSGHNCIAGQLLILSSDWPQREEFLAAIREVFDRLPSRTPWYPGAAARLANATATYPSAERHGADGTRLLVEIGLTPDLCTTEYFAPVLGHTTLPGTGRDFLTAAIAFANDNLAGTLGASILIKPRDRRRMGAAFDEALADLRYGNIGINAWTGVNFFVPGLPWGAFPGHTLENVGSGIGVVHNARLLADTERSVVTGAFRPFPRSVFAGEFSLSPRPPWFVTARTADVTGRRLTRFATKPSWLRLPAVVLSAFRG